MADSRKKIILIRLDKIGDLISTLPVDQILDDTKYDVAWVVQKGMGAVVDLGARKRTCIELDKSNPKESAKKFQDFLKSFQPEVAISFQGPWWINFELFKAGVKTRSGVYSQWHSFLFLNSGVRQSRSKAEKHEFDYNKDLLLNTLNLKDDRRIHFFEIAKPTDLSLLQKFNLTAKNYLVVHPGMMGSALNWSQAKYIDYIQKQIDQGETIAVTGTQADEPYLTDIKSQFENHPQVRWLQNQVNLKDLVLILAESKKVIAPSTGVAHIAASVGADVHGIYSPVRVHHPRRWAPRGPNVTVYLPAGIYTQDPGTILKEDIDPSCMNQIIIR
ncbi:MAG: glycosyltransferase family 9 protein [Bdellovibrio sp.]|nr:glycosyltransferase family 9 protein [Bdellovibrio sp.]